MEDYKSRIKALLTDRKKILPVLLVIDFIIVALLGYFTNGFIADNYLNRGDGGQGAPVAEPVKEAEKVRRWIDGVYVEKGKDNLAPFSVMIENHVDARPQSGLSRASLVYEAEAEGGITRFLAVFAGDGEIAEIGPVRSARPYYIDWANELRATYVHCGGSPEALAKIINERIIDLNEFYNAGTFWRDNKRFAPHNVYTSYKKLADYAERKNIAAERSGMVSLWKFKDDAPESARPLSAKTTIFYKGEQFTAEWAYDNIKNDYLRFQDAKKHLDKDGSEIRAKNIIIQYVQSVITDEVGRRQITTVGKGKAEVCQDGKCRDANWKKSDKKARTIFSDMAGAEIEFNAGKIWIEIVPIGYQVKIE